jgi:hypothetical protein
MTNQSIENPSTTEIKKEEAYSKVLTILAGFFNERVDSPRIAYTTREIGIKQEQYVSKKLRKKLLSWTNFLTTRNVRLRESKEQKTTYLTESSLEAHGILKSLQAIKKLSLGKKDKQRFEGEKTHILDAFERSARESQAMDAYLTDETIFESKQYIADHLDTLYGGGNDNLEEITLEFDSSYATDLPARIIADNDARRNQILLALAGVGGIATLNAALPIWLLASGANISVFESQNWLRNKSIERAAEKKLQKDPIEEIQFFQKLLLEIQTHNQDDFDYQIKLTELATNWRVFENEIMSKGKLSPSSMVLIKKLNKQIHELNINEIENLDLADIENLRIKVVEQSRLDHIATIKQIPPVKRTKDFFKTGMKVASISIASFAASFALGHQFKITPQQQLAQIIGVDIQPIGEVRLGKSLNIEPTNDSFLQQRIQERFLGGGANNITKLTPQSEVDLYTPTAKNIADIIQEDMFSGTQSNFAKTLASIPANLDTTTFTGEMNQLAHGRMTFTGGSLEISNQTGEITPAQIVEKSLANTWWRSWAGTALVAGGLSLLLRKNSSLSNISPEFIANYNSSAYTPEIESSQTPLPIELVSLEGEQGESQFQTTLQQANEISPDWVAIKNNIGDEHALSVGQIALVTSDEITLYNNQDSGERNGSIGVNLTEAKAIEYIEQLNPPHPLVVLLNIADRRSKFVQLMNTFCRGFVEVNNDRFEELNLFISDIALLVYQGQKDEMTFEQVERIVIESFTEYGGYKTWKSILETEDSSSQIKSLESSLELLEEQLQLLILEVNGETTEIDFSFSEPVDFSHAMFQVSNDFIDSLKFVEEVKSDPGDQQLKAEFEKFGNQLISLFQNEKLWLSYNEAEKIVVDKIVELGIVHKWEEVLQTVNSQRHIDDLEDKIGFLRTYLEDYSFQNSDNLVEVEEFEDDEFSDGVFDSGVTNEEFLAELKDAPHSKNNNTAHIISFDITETEPVSHTLFDNKGQKHELNPNKKYLFTLDGIIPIDGGENISKVFSPEDAMKYIQQFNCYHSQEAITAMVEYSESFIEFIITEAVIVDSINVEHVKSVFLSNMAILYAQKHSKHNYEIGWFENFWIVLELNTHIEDKKWNDFQIQIRELTSRAISS